MARIIQTRPGGAAGLSEKRARLQQRVVARSLRKDNFPFKVKLAVAANNGRIDAGHMKKIRAREKALQREVNKESNDLNKAMRTDNRFNQQMEANDLANTFKKIGLITYMYNFPNKQALNAAKAKSRKGDSRLIVLNTASKYRVKREALEKRLGNVWGNIEKMDEGQPALKTQYKMVGGVRQKVQSPYEKKELDMSLAQLRRKLKQLKDKGHAHLNQIKSSAKIPYVKKKDLKRLVPLQ